MEKARLWRLYDEVDVSSDSASDWASGFRAVHGSGIYKGEANTATQESFSKRSCRPRYETASAIFEEHCSAFLAYFEAYALKEVTERSWQHCIAAEVSLLVMQDDPERR